MRYRQRVENDFSGRMELFSSSECIRDVISAVENTENSREKAALMFLYAYMPLGDISDYDVEFWRSNVQCAFQARKEMPWGNDVPEKLFRHYVLPLRVNNENLDTCRMVFFKELKD
ncbi:MAG: transglutaminase domain-containing protein, partial [Alistipes sp.]|nr:transglutaminase domain-containing protein [Candidatus Minthomonas equi]